LGNAGVDDSRLDRNTSVLDIDLENVVEAGQAFEDSPLDWKSAAPQTPAPAPGYERNPFPGADSDQALYPCAVGRQQDRGRDYAEVGQAVAFIGAELIWIYDQPPPANNRAKLFDDARIHKRLSVVSGPLSVVLDVRP